MKKNTVGYCWNCARHTEHRVIECKESVFVRAFEIVFTCGFGLMFEQDYRCKCKECGHINTLQF